MSARFPAMMRLLLAGAAACLLIPAASGALAQSDPKPATRPAAKPAAAPAAGDTKKPARPARKPEAGGGAPAGAKLVQTFGDWGAYTAQSGRAQICYALSEPKSRSPASLKDTKAYLFVSFRPAENIRNEVASVLNFKAKEGGAATLAIGSTNYDLVTQGENAWIKAQQDEGAAIAAMSKANGTVTVQALSARGNKTSDRYSLSGFAQALERAKRDCP